MKNIGKYIMLLMVPLMSLVACKKDEPELESAPSASDASFSYQTSSESDNILTFRASNSGVRAIWDFGNGTTAQGTNVTAQYPNKGSYTVKLTIFSNGGSANTSQIINIADDDFALLKDTLFTMLTGGIDSVNGKTWVVDSANGGHFGLSPHPSHPDFDGYYPKWYSATSNEKVGAGMYDDRYVFKLNAYKFDMLTNGEVFIDDAQGGNFPGAVDLSPDKRAPFPDQIGDTWTITKGSDTTLSLSGSSFLGHYTGTNTYRIVKLTENELYVGFEDDSDGDLMWYVRLIPEGYDPNAGGGGGGGSTGFSLPIDFEVEEPVFVPFGNSTAAVIDNPAGFGINSSNRVLETVHGNEVWAGVSVDLDAPLDFSTNTKIALKVFSTITGTFRVKIEEQANSNNFVEVDVNIAAINTWIPIEADFSGAASGTYDKIALFPGYNTTTNETYYIDDIMQKN